MNKKLSVWLMVLIPVVVLSACVVLICASNCDKTKRKLRCKRKNFFKHCVRVQNKRI